MLIEDPSTSLAVLDDDEEEDEDNALDR